MRDYLTQSTLYTHVYTSRHFSRSRLRGVFRNVDAKENTYKYILYYVYIYI